jgi:SulP family sulfate permease
LQFVPANLNDDIKFIMKSISISERFQTYDSEKFRRDLSAGTTIAFVALPQSMAYALIAGVEPQYGLYAFIVGSIVGSLLGSSRHLQTGPTNATSIVVASTLAVYVSHDNFMGIVFLLGMISGIFQLAAGLLKLGNMTQFISRSVLTGFIAGAGFLIAANQLPNLVGIPRSNSSSIFGGLYYVFQNLAIFHPETVVIGAGTILIAWLVKKISPKSSAGIPIFPPYLAALLVSAGAVTMFNLEQNGVKVVGKISGSLPPFSLPALDWSITQNLTTGAIAIALIGFAEATSAAKTAASFAGDKLDSDREFFGQGMAKIIASFFSGIPVSGSLTRTLLCYRAGAATKFANIFAGLLLTVIVLFFGPVAKYIPLAALAGIVMMIATSMVDIQYMKLAIKSTRADALALLATFAAALVFPLDIAIYIGVGLSLTLFLRRVRIPHITELHYNEESGFQETGDTRHPYIPELAIVQVAGEIFFGGVDLLEEEVQKIARRPEVKVVILRMKRAFCLDATSIFTLMKIYNDMKKQNKLLIISGATEEVEKIFHKSGFDEVIGEEHIFYAKKILFKSTLEAFDHAIEYINKQYGTRYKVGIRR